MVSGTKGCSRNNDQHSKRTVSHQLQKSWIHLHVLLEKEVDGLLQKKKANNRTNVKRICIFISFVCQ